MNKPERIQKLIANFGKYSRRETELLIKENRIKINGKLAKLGDKATTNDTLEIDGKVHKWDLKKVYYVLNKPKGYISSKQDVMNREVLSLIPNSTERNLFTIGRLDVNTSGLIIITNDGELTKIISSPSSSIKKTYLCWINKELSKHDVLSLSRGVMLPDGYVTKPAKVKIINNEDGKSCIKISIKEGKNNQIKRMVESLGEDIWVTNLKRVSIGNLKLDSLQIGHHKEYTKENIFELLGV